MGIDLLSSKGKILAAIWQNEQLNVKDIPDIAQVSYRTCYAQLRLFEQNGVIEKVVDPLDNRRAIVRLKLDNVSAL